MKVLIVSATVAFIVAFAVSVLIGLYYMRKYPKAESISREKQASETITIFFMVMTSVYTAIGIALDRLDPIVLSFFVAGVFGNVVGAKSVEAIQKAGKK